MVVLVLEKASNIGQSRTIENCVRGIRPDSVYVCDSMFEMMLAPLTICTIKFRKSQTFLE